MRGISWVAEDLFASQEGLCCMEWVSYVALVDWHWNAETEILGKKPVPFPLRPPQIQRELDRRKCIKIEVIETSRRKWVASRTCVGGDAEECLFLVQCRSQAGFIIWQSAHAGLRYATKLASPTWIKQDRQCTYKSNIEAFSHNHCCHVTASSYYIFWEYVCV